jgi:hypothetical protein
MVTAVGRITKKFGKITKFCQALLSDAEEGWRIPFRKHAPGAGLTGPEGVRAAFNSNERFKLYRQPDDASAQPKATFAPGI